MTDVDQFQDLPQRQSPVTRLPPEILAHFFELHLACVGSLASHGAYPQGPFCLAQVCKLWRAVAEMDPHLWTSIRFYFPESNGHKSRKADVRRVRALFDLHLERSGTLPISLTFTDLRTYDSETEDLISLLVDRLRTHARRWMNISFQLSCNYYHRLYKFTPCDLSSLEHFYINSDVEAALHHNRVCLDLNSATNLKSFTYTAPRWSVDDVKLHWENLSEVSFSFAPHTWRGYTLHFRLRHLVQCQNITTCCLGIEGDSIPRLDSIQAITLPCLQTLRVRRLSASANAGYVIDPLILPQLHTLEIDASNLVIRYQCWHSRTFSGLLARSGCTLLHLSIQDVDFPNHELTHCLELSPSLTSFRFIPCPRSQDIRDILERLDVALTVAKDWGREGLGGPLVPQLRDLTLGILVKGHLDPILAVFRSRVGARAHALGATQLSRAHVVFFDLWHDRDVDRVHLPGERLESVVTFRAVLAQSGFMNRNEDGQGKGDKDGLEVSVVVDSPYLPQYVDVQ